MHTKSTARRLREYRVSFYAGAQLPSASEINAVFSWRVVRANTIRGAIALALANPDTQCYEWQWALVRVSKNSAIHAIQIQYNPN